MFFFGGGGGESLNNAHQVSVTEPISHNVRDVESLQQWITEWKIGVVSPNTKQ